jgi:hypothetical protein
MWEDRVIMWEDFGNELLSGDAKVMPLRMGNKKIPLLNGIFLFDALCA